MGKFDRVLLASDFDNTLVHTKAALDAGSTELPPMPKRNREALEYFTQNGGYFSVSTGRALPAFSSVTYRCVPHRNFLRNPDSVHGRRHDSARISGPFSAGIQTAQPRALTVFVPHNPDRTGCPALQSCDQCVLRVPRNVPVKSPHSLAEIPVQRIRKQLVHRRDPTGSPDLRKPGLF